jgi:hypothetical protein
LSHGVSKELDRMTTHHSSVLLRPWERVCPFCCVVVGCSATAVSGDRHGWSKITQNTKARRNCLPRDSDAQCPAYTTKDRQSNHSNGYYCDYNSVVWHMCARTKTRHTFTTLHTLLVLKKWGRCTDDADRSDGLYLR